MATGRVNVGGGGGRLNIFTQLTEPSKKEGIWIKTNRAYKKATVDENVFLSGEWIDEPLEQTPYPASNIGIASDGRYVYISGGSLSGTNKNFYRYDTVSDMWTKLPDLPIGSNNHSVIVVGNFIYMVGGGTSVSSSGRSECYKFDVNNMEWSQINSMPNSHFSTGLTSDRNFIYCSGGNTGGVNFTYRRDFYKYDIVSNTWSIMPPSINTSMEGNLSMIGNRIYRTYQRSSSNNGGVEAFDIESEEWSDLSIAIPSNRHPKQTSAGTSLYLIDRFGNYFYEIDTIDKSLSQIPEIPVPSNIKQGLRLTATNNRVVLMGGDDYNNRNNLAYSLSSKQYTNGDIIIVRTDDNTGAYKTELSSALPMLQGDKFTRLTTGFNDVYMYYDNDLHSLEAYYGDGTQWIKFKEAI